MVYFFRKKNGPYIGWKTAQIGELASERARERLQELSVGNPDGVTVGLVETNPQAFGINIEEWVNSPMWPTADFPTKSLDEFIDNLRHGELAPQD